MNPISGLYRVIAIVLALLMFTTSVSFALDMHYCGGRLRSVGFFSGAKACTGETAAAARPSCRHADGPGQHPVQTFQKKNCCQNRTLHVASAQERIVPVDGLAISKPLQQFVAAFVQAFFPLNAEPALEYIPFAQYRPPLIRRDILVLTQSFLL